MNAIAWGVWVEGRWLTEGGETVSTYHSPFATAEAALARAKSAVLSGVIWAVCPGGTKGVQSLPRHGKLPYDNSLPTLAAFSKADGELLLPGSAVVADNDEGLIREGNIEMLLPWGAEFIDPAWRTVTVVIRDHESNELSSWRPERVNLAN